MDFARGGRVELFRDVRCKTALPPKAEVHRRSCYVAKVPCVDGSELARVFFTFAGWSVQPCVRPVSAAHRPLAIMPSADQVPVKSPHSTMRWHMWVVLIAGIDRLCITCCSPSQPSHHADGRRDLVYTASATGSL